MILETMTPQWTPLCPAVTRTAPMRPPNMACEELDGRPSSQVTRFQMMAPARPAKTIVGVTSASLTMPELIVRATSVDRQAPTMLRTAATVTAILGRKAPVATAVAIELEESWKPLVKSKTKAVTTTITTIARVIGAHARRCSRSQLLSYAPHAIVTARSGGRTGRPGISRPTGGAPAGLGRRSPSDLILAHHRARTQDEVGLFTKCSPWVLVAPDVRRMPVGPVRRPRAAPAPERMVHRKRKGKT